jgi:hypothetical protein
MAQLGDPKEFGLPKISERAQSTVPGTFHNRMVFMICRMGMWVLHSGHRVDFEQWSGQVDQRRFVHLCLCAGFSQSWTLLTAGFGIPD